MYGSGVMPGRRAGSGVYNFNAESPKQGSKRFNSITKTIHFAHLNILFTVAIVLSGPLVKGAVSQDFPLIISQQGVIYLRTDLME